MPSAVHELPDNIAELKAMVLASRAALHSRDLLIEKLKHQLAGLRRHQFGARSESLDQLELTLEAEEIARAAEQAPAAHDAAPHDGASVPDETKDEPRRRPLPDHLPRHEMVLPAPEACTACGGKLKPVGEDVTEQLEYIPGRFVVNRIVRPRVACACCETFHQAPLPSRPIERGRPGPGLLAHVLVNKYADHLPLYRQSQIFARDRVDLDRSTLAGWVGASTALLEPLADAIGRHVLTGQAIFADDTPVKMQAPGMGKTKTARLWVYGRDERPWSGEAPPAAWYRFSIDRKGERPAEHLKSFTGWMHADGYAGFEELYRSGTIREVACMAHIRRKFVDIQQSQGSAIAEEAIKRIADARFRHRGRSNQTHRRALRHRGRGARPTTG
jgi:transposase